MREGAAYCRFTLSPMSLDASALAIQPPCRKPGSVSTRTPRARAASERTERCTWAEGTMASSSERTMSVGVFALKDVGHNAASCQCRWRAMTFATKSSRRTKYSSTATKGEVTGLYTNAPTILGWCIMAATGSIKVRAFSKCGFCFSR